MNCSLEIEMDIRADIEMMAKEGLPSVEVNKDGSSIFANFTQNRTELFDQMRKNVAAINEKYNSVKYGKIAKLNTGHIYGLSIDINLAPEVVKEAVDASNKVAEIEVSRKLQEEDAKRKGETFTARYMFDDLLDEDSPVTPTNPGAYDYALVLDKKKQYRDYLTHRINVLKEVPIQTKEIKGQVAHLNTIVRSLSNDIKELERSENTVHNFFHFFNKDLINIEKILKKAPSLENITTLKNYFDSLSPVLEVDILNSDFQKNNRFSRENTPGNIQDLEVAKLFADFKAKHDKLQEDFKIASNQYVKEILKISEGTDSTSAVIEEELSKFKKLLAYNEGILEYAFLPIEGQGTDPNTIQALIRKLYDDAVAKKEKSHIQSELMFLKSALEKKLKESTRNIFGFSFSKKDYGIFKRLTKEGNYRLVSKFSDAWSNLTDEVNKLLWEAEHSRVDTAGLSSAQIEQNLKAYYEDIRKNRKEAFDKLINSGVEFIDSTMLPEFADNTELMDDTLPNLELLMGLTPGTLTNEFSKTPQERQAYKEKLLKTLGGNSQKREVAEKEYNKIQKKQIEQIFEFEAELNERIQTFFEAEGVTEFSQLKEETKTKIKNFYYTNSPLEFVKMQKDINSTGKAQTSNIKTHSTYIDKTGLPKETRELATLKYVSYLPTNSSSYNSKFEQEIESDPTFLRAWELFDESYEFLNKNRKYKNEYKGGYAPEYMDAITNQYDTMQDNALGLRHGNSHFEGLGKKFGYNLLENIIGVLSVNTRKDNAKMQIKGVIKSLDEVVEEETNIILKGFEAIGYKGRVLMKDFSKDSPNGGKSPRQIIEEMLASRGITVSDENSSLKDNIKVATRERTFKNQDNDMVKSIVNQLSAIQVFKAKKEVEVPMTYLASIASKINKENSTKENQDRVNLINYFIESNLYDKNVKVGTKRGLLNFKVLNSEERYYTHLAKISKRERQKLIDSGNFSPDVQAGMEQSIKDLDELIANMGKQMSLGAIVEGIFIKLAINAGLGWNLKSQILNLSIGNLATRQNDGTFWKSGNAVKAMSYTRNWKRALKFANSKHKNNIILTDAILDTMGIFQNSANDIAEMEKEFSVTTEFTKFDNFKPLAIISAVEKSIQRPQILSMMGDIMIQGKNNTSVPAFNVKNTSNPHPAFEIVQGRLQLKPEFDTEENRNTWILKKSAEYADNFGNSGKIPTVIAKINGDYRRTSRVMAKKNLVGAIFMTYKTWMASNLIRRYGKEGAVSQLADKQHSVNALMVLGGIAYGASMLGGLTVIAPYIGVGIAGAYAFRRGRKAMKNSIAKDVKTIDSLIQALTIANTKNAFFAGGKFAIKTAKGAGGVVLGGTLKFAQQTSDWSGHRFISDDLINKSLLMDQSEEETDAEYARNLANMQFLLTELATLAQILAAKALINLFLTPDDEEEDEYGDADWAEKFSNHKATMLYYLSENLLGQFGQDIAFSINPYNAITAITGGALRTVEDMFKVLGYKMQGKDYYESGKNEGRSRIVVQFEKMAIPVGVRDIMKGGVPTAGFRGPLETDYTKGDYFNKLSLSQAKIFEENKREIRDAFRAEKTEEIKKIYSKEVFKQEIIESVKAENPTSSPEIIDKRINKLYEKAIKKEVDRLNDIEHPSIKSLFNEKGELIDLEYAEYLSKYDEALSKELIEKREEEKKNKGE